MRYRSDDSATESPDGFEGSNLNITIDLHISQMLTKPGGREKRIGRASATFHVTPKVHHKQKRSRRT